MTRRLPCVRSIEVGRYLLASALSPSHSFNFLDAFFSKSTIPGSASPAAIQPRDASTSTSMPGPVSVGCRQGN
ncbi:uncharacterized protein BDZ83DRAFT_133207 [Colletotrichum acutatum]|uniref:Uncharacterized protein n=1 Tax=Glomerella acutata TaxID=27357 RepID=A0AAD8XA70_GLOAC|nr:uncharacterized protein BDZ83DRAFT_133207 [Colletotrichum acutatum]KAK1710311.1 hypothetical protein BDZ83DRAFT_133207 [Colletotrichum acutatum]